MAKKAIEEVSKPAIPENLVGKKVVLVNHSDTLGGAAIVTFRLMQALRKQGVDARMVVFTKYSQEPMVDSVGSRFGRSMRFVLERLKLWVLHGVPYSKVFMVSTSDFAINVNRHPWVKEADIVCLNWFNQGLLGLEGIRKLHRMGKKIVWTMHDMWAFTGICHHAYECDHYRDACGNCMFLSGGGRPNDISHRVLEAKRRLYAEVPISFVTVCTWLERKAKASALLHDQQVRTIHNAFPTEQFYTTPKQTVGSLLTNMKPNVILFVAARIDDPIKGLDYTIEAVNRIFDNNPEIAQNTAIYFIGGMKHPERLDEVRLSHRWLGMVTDIKMLSYLYASAKVVVSTSLYENLAGTLIEGQASGALPVTFGEDGRADIVEHKKNGYIARYKDSADVARGILWALQANVSREKLHHSVEERFGSATIARRYIDLFSELLAK